VRKLFILLFSIAIAGNAFAQSPECNVEGIPINTGTHGNVALPIGVGDPNWTVIGDPDPLTTEPRPAGTIAHLAGVWKPPQPGSTWISSYPTEVNDLDGTYSYQYCFCLAEKFDAPKLTLSLRADDWAEVFLNGQSLGATANPGYATASPQTIATSSPSHFRPGRNCIRVDVMNDGGQYSGFNLVGQMSAVPNALQRPQCCNPTGSIQGRKFEDANGNGVSDDDPGLAGWTITLSNGQTAVTDANGYYSFMNLPPGNYTISETQQSGWQQTSPPGGKHSVGVKAGTVSDGLDFSNRRSDELPTDGPCSLCGQINSVCCLGKNEKGQTIYSFNAPITYQSFSTPPTTCQLVVTAPPGVTIVSFGPAVALPGTMTYVSGTFVVTGTPPKPFCIKVRCTGGKESCESAVCIRELPACDR
jgi:hypothetical protein